MRKKRIRVAIFNNIEVADLNNNFELVDFEQRPEVLLARSENLRRIDLPESLCAICRVGSGVDNIPVDECVKNGIAVFNTPGANANSVKELVIWALIDASRKASLAAENVKKNLETETDWEKEKKKYTGTEVKNKKILIIGLGNIGSLVAEACLGLGMDVHGYDPYATGPVTLGLKHIIVSKIDDYLNEYDFVTLHPNLSEKTKGIINSDFLSKLKSGVVVLNFARKEMVDGSAMEHALKTNHVRMYVCDFPDKSFSSFLKDKIVILPHLGASTAEAQERAINMAIHKITGFMLFGEVSQSLNFPDCNPGPLDNGKSRIIIVNHNIPGMIGKYSKVLGEQAINISHFVNENKGSIGYSVIDIETGEKQELDVAVNAIRNQEGVLKVRTL